ncbi:hypothetical protein [Polycladomyces subterraneus]|uniref:Drought induced 19 protein type zinc-binding domain-containing protein n=1 Tax=Polycladomyces subterraneus TaxID=1016997 RepID=A0ABT8IRW1_9BACL|nr:hypothetical protein [Polycladomyces subterraneus]MDN4595495.1 hypothetical protein [Polycladomyces subterraneus]
MMQTVDYGCPICNGLISLSILCPNCGEPMEDHGRLLDFFANYSPYRPIDDLKKTDGWIDEANHQCPHVVYCPHCDFSDTLTVAEVHFSAIHPDR